MDVEIKERVERENIIKFLVTNVSRINRIKAENIVKILEDTSLELMVGDNKYLLGIKGISEKSISKIQEGLQVYTGLKEILKSVDGLDQKGTIINAIYKGIGSRAITKVKENPYCICDKCNIDFNTADKIALSLGLKFDNENRIKQGIMCVLSNEMKRKGDLFTYKIRLLKELLEFIKKINVFKQNFVIELKLYDEALNSLILDGEIVIEEDNYIYRSDYHEIENGIVDRVKSCLKQYGFCENEDKVREHESLKNYNLTEEQSNAVVTALTNKITIITGGPGTGKTSIMKILLSVINAINPDAHVQISAPTGKAAITASKAIGQEAKTIHRLLNLSVNGSNNHRVNKVECDFLIIDESSMIDGFLFNELLINTDNKTNIVIVGDHQQLPSVGPGSILRDLINSKQVPVVTLKELYRQAKTSLIVKNSNILVDDEKLDKERWLEFDNDEFVFIEEIEEKITDKILLTMEHLIFESNYSQDDIMILSPVKSGDFGTSQLNLKLQEWYYEGTPSNSKIINNHDRVIQTVNNYKIGVMNGEVGKIKNIREDHDGDLYYNVDIGGRVIEYNKDIIEQLDLAYIITIHKSQGSEYKVIIIPVSNQNMYMANLNMIYTGITRSKTKVILIGDKSAFFKAINSKGQDVRNSRIIEKLNN